MAWYNPRDLLLGRSGVVPKQEQDKVVCVTTFCSVSNKITKSIRKHWPLLSDIGIPGDAPLFSFRRGRNIRDHLVHSTLPVRAKANTMESLWGLKPVVGHYKCGNCAVCAFTLGVKKFSHGTIEVDLKHFSNCNTANVVYAIWCPCGWIYIGQTTQPVKSRIIQHRSRIRCQTASAPLVAHYLALNHTEDEILWQVVEVVKLPPRGGSLSKLLLRAECKWITKCRSIDSGLNTLDEWNGAITEV
mgnify:CR=1 FL=1